VSNINPIETVQALERVRAGLDYFLMVKEERAFVQGARDEVAALLAQMQSQPSDERKAAEHEYACTAFDYPSAPVGSRDWTLFWKGWQAARALGPVKAQQEPVAWPKMPPSKGQSPVLFEDGYAEGWAKCLSACKEAVADAAHQGAHIGVKPIELENVVSNQPAVSRSSHGKKEQP
jgi:hypothetical protein